MNKLSTKRDLIGRRFGRLVGLERVGVNKYGYYIWAFLCDCGQVVHKPSNYVVSGDTQSCGCFRKEATTTHRMSKTPFYRVWAGILNRCEKPNTKGFQNYGGRGIKASRRWHKFENFRDDMFESYKIHIGRYGRANTTIERIQNNRGYSEANCRWATWSEQAKNKRPPRKRKLVI